MPATTPVEVDQHRRSLSPLRRIGAWLCFFVALYFLATILYTAFNFERYGTALPQLLRYIVVPAAIVVLFVGIPFVLSREKTALVGIYSACILATLFLVEATLTMRTIPVLFGSLGQLEDDKRQEVETNDSMIRGFTLGRLNYLAEVDSLDKGKLSGFAGSKTLLCSRPDGPRIYTADRYGFNNPDSVYDRAADVMFVGDSFLEGFCLPEGEDLAAAMREQGTNAITLGIRGNGPLLELAAIGRYGPTLRPPHVIMAFYAGNDWRNLGNELKTPWLRTALDPDADFGDPMPTNPGSDDVFSEVIQTITQEHVTTFDLLRKTSVARNFFALHRVGHALGIIYPKVPATISEYEAVLRRAKQIVESWGGRFSLLYIPDAGRFGSLLPTGFAYDQLRDQVVDAANTADVDMIDLVPIFGAQDDPRRFYAADGHFSVEGADFVAAVLADIGNDNAETLGKSGPSLAEE